MNRLAAGTVLGLLLLLAASPAAAQGGQCEMMGQVADHEGNPIPDVVVKVWAESNTALVYSGKTNKKGRYFIPGLFTAKEGDMWAIAVEAEGLVPYTMHVESRTANRTLISDPRTVKLGPRKAIPSIIIRPLGEAMVNFALAPPDKVAELLGVPEEPAATERAQQQQQQQQDAYDQALTLAADGDLEGALPFFIKAVENEPEDAERHRAYAQVLYKLEYYDQAEVEAKKAVELDGQEIGGHLVLYTIYVAKGDLEAAGTALDAARQIDPQNLDLLRQVAFVASQGGSPEEQIAAHRSIVEVAPRETQSWLALGDLYARTGNNLSSEEAYQKVVELDPDNADQVFFNLGALLMNDDDRTEVDVKKAITAFRKAVEINPKYGHAYRELGLALLNVGDKAGARGALEQYVKVAPEAPDAAQMKQLIKALPAA